MLKQSRAFFCGVLSDNEKQGPSVSDTTMAFTLIAWNKARLDCLHFFVNYLFDRTVLILIFQFFSTLSGHHMLNPPMRFSLQMFVASSSLPVATYIYGQMIFICIE